MARKSRPQLSTEEINELFSRYRDRGDPDARETLVGNFTPLVESIARQYARYGEPVEDLTQEGFIGLIKAVEMYDVNRGVKFVTYSTHLIQGEIKHYLRDRTGIIREPGWLNELNTKISKGVDHLTQKHGRFPSVAEIAEHIGIEEAQVQDVMRTRGTFRVGSLDAPTDDEGDGDRGHDLGKLDTEQTGGLTLSLPVEERIVLAGAMDTLKRVEREVVECFFFKDLTQTEIARRLGISCNYVSHLIRSSMGKLRRSLMGEEHREASIRVRAALDRRRAYLDARQRAGNVDPITGLYSEAHLEERLQEETARSRRYGHELGFALIEAERFGKFVSERTEQAGNQALKTVADMLVANLRKVDVAMRYGQIGFGVILPHTAEVSERVIARLVKRVQKERIGAHTPRARGLTLRAGVAVFPLDGLAAEDIFSAARDALTAAGEEGGAVVRAEPLSLEDAVLEAEAPPSE